MPSNLSKSKTVPQVPTTIPLQGFAPDSDPIVPGIMPDLNNLYATAKGFRSYPSLVVYSLNALPGPCVGAFAGWLGNQFVIAAGTANQLFLFNAATRLWVAQSGITIGPGNVSRWRFDIYGNLLIAANGLNPPFSYNGTGSFVPLPGGPPVTAIVQATDYDLFLIPPNSRDYWFSLSATIWTPSIATQTVHGQITSTHGNILAAQKLRDGLALYKNEALHMGQFTQPPFYWDFRTVSQEVGVPCQEAVANLGEVHYFPGNDDFYYFDGYSLNRIPNDLKEWFLDHLDGDFRDRIVARWDSTKNLVFWHFPSVQANPAGSLDMWIALNVRNGKWTASTSVTGVEMPIFSSIPFSRFTYGTFQQTYATYGAIPARTYGDVLQSHASDVPAVIGTDHVLKTYSGTPESSSFTTHFVGDRLNMFQVSRIRPEFTLYPSGGVVCNVTKQYVPGLQGRPGASPAPPGPPQQLVSTLSEDGWFNLVSTARLQQFKLDFTGDLEIVALELDADFAGER